MLQVGIIVGALAAPHFPRHGYPPILFMLKGHLIAKSLTVYCSEFARVAAVIRSRSQ